VLQGADSIFADGFAIYGLTELARATRDQAVIDLALATYANVQRRLAVPGSYGIGPFTLPPNAKAHAVSMIFALVFDELGQLLGDQAIVAAGRAHADQVMDAFLRPDQRLLYEYVHLDNTLIDAPQGRSIVPGHAIESMWFMIEIYQRAGQSERIRQAVEAIRWHLALGWDDEYGGIVHACDAEGGQP
jgi:N-acylglucosamine 2-epimerase